MDESSKAGCDTQGIMWFFSKVFKLTGVICAARKSKFGLLNNTLLFVAHQSGTLKER